jgi:hypothetical protein
VQIASRQRSATARMTGKTDAFKRIGVGTFSARAGRSSERSANSEDDEMWCKLSIHQRRGRGGYCLTRDRVE